MNFIKFLGTAGSRFVVMKQLRASGGIWVRYKDTNVLIDPGPGSLVKCSRSRPKLSPEILDSIILTHKHLDHSNDVNAMVEAMTGGGFKQRGILFAPADALGESGVIYSYLKNHPQDIKIIKPGGYQVKDISFQVPTRNLHSVETYGLKFYLGKEIVSFISDTKYFADLINIYKQSTIVVLNVVFLKRKDEYDHLCLDDAIKIIGGIGPKTAILTHFGMTMLKAKPQILEEKLNKELESDVKFAYDGLTFELD